MRYPLLDPTAPPLDRILGPLGAEVFSAIHYIMRHLNLTSVTVRDVYELIKLKRPIAYTTVMTIFNTLQAANLLHRLPQQAIHHKYEPTMTESDVICLAIHHMTPKLTEMTPNG